MGRGRRQPVQDMDHEPVPQFTREEALRILAAGKIAELMLLPTSVAMFSDDFKWAQSICRDLASHEHHGVRGNAIGGLGHLALRFGILDEATIRPIIEKALQDPHEFVRGHAYDAAEDVKHIQGWEITGFAET